MSMMDNNRSDGLSLNTMETNGRLLIVAINNLSNIISAIFPRTVGSATLSASATTVVTQPAVAANSFVEWVPTNAAAASLEGSARNLYLSARTPGASFALTTANGSAAGGNETILYQVWTPV